MNIPPQIGNYKLEREIGRGASSEVWLARHSHLTDHLVAIKVLMSQDREAIRRFQREALIASRLRHPYIAQLYDYGYTQPFFYTMIEYIEGGSLRQLIEKQGRLQLDLALSIFRQIATALDYAHSLSIVHRDVSPGNILFEQRTGRALLTDFGISRDTGQAITVANPIMGTPGYLSPEHMQGTRSVTHLSDLFGLGVILYQMLSGQLPWDDVPGMPDGPGFSPPIPLKQRGVENLPGDVDRVLRTMLAIDPTRRFPSARAAVDELERIFSRHQMATQIVAGTPRPNTASPVELQSVGVESNDVEAVLGPDLLRAPIDRAHRRAEELRSPSAISVLLDTWATQSPLRRRFLGRLARLHKVSSHNVYFYRLRLLYEQRSPATDDEEPDRKAEPFTIAPELDRWEIDLAPASDFVDEPGERVILPGSTRVVACKPCGGRGVTVCPTCNGKQRVLVSRPVAASSPAGSLATSVASGPASSASGSVQVPAPDAGPRTEQVLVPCPECSGRGGLTCARCDGVGRLVQRKAFRWRRHAQIIRGQDDLPALDEDWLRRTCKAEVIYSERQAAGLRPEWSLVPTLAALLEGAVNGVDADTRIVLSEVTVSFIPVTNIVFDLGKPGDRGLYKLAIYGFESHIPPDWRFLAWERVVSICAIALLCLVSVILAGFAFL